MKTICKKEIRTYLTTMSGYVFIAFTLFAVGIYFTAYHMAQGYPTFSYTLQSCTFLFLIITPILTMRSLAGEERQKTDQLLLTSPISIRSIVLGKYFGMLSVFGMAMAIVCLYPLIMTLYGTVNLPAAYTGIFGYFLLGAACIAIGLFISSLTSNPIIAAVITFGVIFLLYMMGGIKSISNSSAFSSYIIYVAAVIAVAVLIFVLMKDAIAALAVGGSRRGGPHHTVPEETFSAGRLDSESHGSPGCDRQFLRLLGRCLRSEEHRLLCEHCGTVPVSLDRFGRQKKMELKAEVKQYEAVWKKQRKQSGCFRGCFRA
jgi:ABC-2 type transport system permease protein